MFCNGAGVFSAPLQEARLGARVPCQHVYPEICVKETYVQKPRIKGWVEGGVGRQSDAARTSRSGDEPI